MKLKILQINKVSRWQKLRNYILHLKVDNKIATVVRDGETKKFTFFMSRLTSAFLLVHYSKNRILGLNQFDNGNWDKEWKIVRAEFKDKLGTSNPTIQQLLGIELNI